MCGSRTYPYPHHRGSLEILRGRGGSKAKIFQGKYQRKLEFPEGLGVQTSVGGSMDIFWNNTIWQRNFSNRIKSGFIVPCAILWDFCNSNDISTQNLWKCIKLGVQNFSKDSYKVKFENITGRSLLYAFGL